MSMITPLFLGGLALLAVPWLVHRIRRPEREPVTFSSLMFVPNIQKKVIERRRIQDVPLMILRMIALMLLVFVFSRPFFTREEAAPMVAQNAVARHLVLVDVSASMGPERIEEAQKTARRIIASLPQSEEVGLSVFHETSQILTPIVPKDGTATRAADRIEGTHFATNYPAALLHAETQLLEDQEQPPPATIHMISDFHRNGVPSEGVGWRLSGLVTFKSYPVGGEETRNLSIIEVGVRQAGDTQIIAGKIKNRTQEDLGKVAVRLFLDDKLVEEKHLGVNAGNASRVEFQLKRSGDFSGWLEIDPDDAAVDNRRYFVWRPPRKPKVLLVTDKHRQSRYPASQFMEMALAKDWSLMRTHHQNLLQDLASYQPDLLMVSSLDGFDEAIGAALLGHVREGGKMLLTLGRVPVDAPLNKAFLQPLGLQSGGLRYSQFLEQRFAMLTDIQFGHPVFQGFSGARFNDFSPLHFYNYHKINILEEGPITLAHFHGAEAPPAVLEVGAGRGRVLIWAFSPELDWTNLPKHVKFVPLLSETARHLTGRERVEEQVLVGETYDPARWDGAVSTRLPDGSQQDNQQPFTLSNPGLISLKIKDSWQITDAVNMVSEELDSELIPPAEFALKLTSAVEDREASVELASTARDKKIEYGYVFLVFLVLAVLVETWLQEYMTHRKKAALQAGSGLRGAA